MTEVSVERQIGDLLARMSVLAEAPGASFIPSGPRAKAGSVILSSRAGDEPLYDKWKSRFEDPRNQDRLETLILLAKRDLSMRTERRPQVLEEETLDSENRILDWFEGVPAAEAAIMESASAKGYCSTSYIRKVRRRNDRDPEKGLPQPAREQRVAECRRLQAEGLSIRKISRELNIAPSTVQRALATADENERMAA